MSVAASQSGLAPAESRVKAADLSQFKPGNIISDAKFFDRGTMSEAQIQQFLQSKVPNCQAGYVCLKDWYDTSRTTSADAMCGAYSGGVRERASTIIYKVAQACGINPQVILVTLQKEQGLVTHTWPSDWRYTIAMGQGCPDTAACDTRYYGFFNQVYGAAWQLKRYANPPGTSQYFTWYAPGKTWNVRWHPNAACGSSPVHIQNQATANLYYYTPYQPNAAALRAGYGEGDGCSSYGNRNFYQYFTDWFGTATGGGNPFGYVESMQSDSGSIRLTGWAADPDTANPIEIHVYVGSVGKAFVAAKERPDVGAAFPALGSRHGFDVRVAVPAAGTHRVCAYGINAGGGTNQLLSCGSVTVSGPIDGGNAPIGYLESLTVAGSTATAAGWAIDPDTTSPIRVRLTVGGSTTTVTADRSRPDVGASYPGSGSNHGFSAKLTLPVGKSTVCAVAVNTGVIGGDVPIGCRDATVAPPTPTVNRAPIGNFESVAASSDKLTITGWAIDPNVTGPIPVHVYVNGVGKAHMANVSRPDVAAAHPGYGDRHGFVVQVPASRGTHQVCVYAIDDAGGTNPTLGCRSVTISAPAPTVNRAPIGNFESVGVSSGTLTIAGWAIDPNVTGPIEVHVYVNGAGRGYTADVSRPDVAAAYPGYGDRHGFVVQVPASTGTHQVCAYAIDTGGGANPTLGCRSVTVSAPAPATNKTPFGNFEGASVAPGALTVSGWAIDPNTTAPIAVHVYVGGVGRAFSANLSRPDVAAAHPASGDAHGFVASMPAPAGTHRVCIYAIDSAGGANPTLGCRSVTVP
ncbi:hypothetical protein [Microbacterium sp. CPCC 204701]|uniref:hypothetical protein n=1 Tax=Microbacterium sp. CPCC 204701 TaxID=2493084 RepID=UPI001F0C618A|nr:hypothetical protein [Microbacterium sp. CPCC 204701]